MPDGAAICRARSGDVCEGCGRPRAGTSHHRVKRSAGGLWHPANLLRLCGSGTTGCHGWAEHHPLHAKACGWSLDPLADPPLEPALIYAGQLWRAWWLLLPTGDYEWQRDPSPVEALTLVMPAAYRAA